MGYIVFPSRRFHQRFEVVRASEGSFSVQIRQFLGDWFTVEKRGCSFWNKFRSAQFFADRVA